jgi:DNA-nicking Smr family endonuclease
MGISDKDRALFKETMKDVHPLKHSQTIPKNKPLAKKKRVKLKEEEFWEEQDLLPSTEEIDPVGPNETLTFVRAGQQSTQLRKLQRGHFGIQGELDLHGLSILQAETAVKRFISQANQQHFRCIKIVHGKGSGSNEPFPKLKNHINKLLRAHPEVLAFCSAKPHDGGVGAVYVLIRSNI